MARRSGGSSIRSSGKTEERRILETARRLADRPDLVTPDYRGGWKLFNPVTKAAKHVRKVHDARDDLEALKRFASRGSRYARAYAVLLRLAHEEEVRYLAQAKLPWGPVSYVNWGDTNPSYHIGLQHWFDPRTRLLAAKEWAQDKGYHVYATGDRLVCTGKRPDAPPSYVDQQLTTLSVELPGEGTTRTCPHGGAGEGPGLRVTWESAEVTLDLCGSCLQREGNTVHRLLERTVGPEPWQDFTVTPVLPPWRTEGDASNAPEPPPPPGDALDDHLRGRLTDAALLDRVRAHRRRALEDAQGPLYVVGDTVYGTDRDAFLDALGPDDAERAALEAALEGHGAPLVLDRASPVRALEMLWDDAGPAILEAITHDADAAHRLHRAVEGGSRDVTDVLGEAVALGDRHRVTSALPTYGSLPPAVQLADAVARTHLAGGPDAARQHLADARPSDGRAKSVAWAFHRALSAHEGKRWKFTPTERELGDALEVAARALLDAQVEGYHDALDRLAREAGLGSLPRPEDAT